MPLQDVINTQLRPDITQQVMQKLQEIKELLKDFSHNLTADERIKYGSINEQNKLAGR